MREPIAGSSVDSRLRGNDLEFPGQESKPGAVHLGSVCLIQALQRIISSKRGIGFEPVFLQLDHRLEAYATFASQF